MKGRMWFAALLGYLFNAGSQMFRQDLMGKEKYMQMVDLMWVDLSPYWGLGIMLIAAFAFVHETRKVP